MKQLKMKGLRASQDLSQDDLAKLIGVTRQTIQGIEAGKIKPSYDMMCKIVIALKKHEFSDVFDIPTDFEFDKNVN